MHPPPARTLLGAALLASAAAHGQTGPVRYEVDLSRAREQLIRVTMTLTGIPADDRGRHTASVHLPVWRPGLYLVLDPAGGIRTISARAGDKPASIDKTARSSWLVDAGDSDHAEITYDLIAAALENRTRHADDTHAFIDPTTVLLYADAWRNLPLEADLILPHADPAWSVACGLPTREVAPGRVRISAPGYDRLADCPIEAGLHHRLAFDVDGIPHEVIVWTGEPAVTGPAPRQREPEAVARWNRLPDDLSAIIRQERAVFGTLPYDRFVFILHAYPGGRGGTEHFNSCVMQTSDFLGDARYPSFLHLVSHEFFHTWNIKRFRPSELAPYDYQRENLTSLLWVAEGTTCYYDGLIPVRAGLEPRRAYLDHLASDIRNDETRLGAAVQPLAHSSFDAWIKFNRRNPDSANSTVSFYDKGALASLLLDMHLRRHGPPGASLDGLMRRLFERFPTGDKGYSEADLRDLIADTAACSPQSPWIHRFFAETIHGTARPDFAEALNVVGLDLEHSTGPARPYLGLSLADEAGLVKVSAVASDSPALDTDAAIIPGDTLIALDGRRITASIVDREVEKRAPGDTITLSFFRYDVLRTITVTLKDKPEPRLRIRESKDASDAQKAQRDSWLGPAAQD